MGQISFETYRGSLAANYERYFVPVIAAPLAQDLIDLADLRPGEHVLDVACGTGVVTRLAAAKVGGAAVAGVDVNADMLEVAREAAGYPEIEWHLANAASLPFEDGTFDVTFCQMGLQFFPDPVGALRELRRVLEPGGRIVLNVPGPTPPPFAVLEEVLLRELGREAAGFVAMVFSLHEPAQVCELIESAGFNGAEARSVRKTLTLPAPADFLWQYVSSTPLAGAVKQLGAERRAELQDEIVAAWEPFVHGDGLDLEVDVTSATANRSD